MGDEYMGHLLKHHPILFKLLLERTLSKPSIKKDSAFTVGHHIAGGEPVFKRGDLSENPAVLDGCNIAHPMKPPRS